MDDILTLPTGPLAVERGLELTIDSLEYCGGLSEALSVFVKLAFCQLKLTGVKSLAYIVQLMTPRVVRHQAAT